MKLNHLHLSVPNLTEARAFYERFFEFRFAFEEKSINTVFLRDEANFLLALHELNAGERVEMPTWFHFGFGQDTAEKVKRIYDELKASNIAMAKDIRSGKDWVTFSCWAPGPYQLEVSWDHLP